MQKKVCSSDDGQTFYQEMIKKYYEYGNYPVNKIGGRAQLGFYMNNNDSTMDIRFCY